MHTLDWTVDGKDWPHAEHSRFVVAGGLRWHVQQMGRGPALLLVHGTGASTHSWRDLMPRLARHYTVVVPDLPGHGFTERPPARRLSLPGMSRALCDLLDALRLRPCLVAGHSAGAAILARACLDRRLETGCLVSINGALLPFSGVAAYLFPSLARLLFLNPLAPRAFAARTGNTRRVRQLIEQGGSHLDTEGIELYRRLLASPPHVGAALGMMANWDLRPLVRDLPHLRVPLLLVAADRDRAVPPERAETVRSRVPGARVQRLPRLGHVAHEEDPEGMVMLLEQTVRDVLAGKEAGCSNAQEC
jgi:magnesium chelatase accessory protein